MKITNVNTLKIHKLTQKQYDKAKQEGKLEEGALYLTVDESTNMPNISYGTEEPDGGSPGDLYIQIVE